MTKRTLMFGLTLIVCCVLTSFVTRWFVISDVRVDYGRAVEFYRYKEAFSEFVDTHTLADGEQVKGDALPARLRAIGIVNVYRNGRFVYFVMPPTSFIADDATCEFIYNLDGKGGVVEEILRTTKRTTYHIQYFTTSPGWYYWMHN